MPTFKTHTLIPKSQGSVLCRNIADGGTVSWLPSWLWEALTLMCYYAALCGEGHLTTHKFHWKAPNSKWWKTVLTHNTTKLAPKVVIQFVNIFGHVHIANFSAMSSPDAKTFTDELEAFSQKADALLSCYNGSQWDCLNIGYANRFITILPVERPELS